MATKTTATTKTATKKIATTKNATKKIATTKNATKKTATKKTAAKKSPSSSSSASSAPELAAQFEQRFAEVGGWRGATLSRMRALIVGADNGIVEERKWVKPSNPHGVPTYSCSGLLLTLEVYKAYVKVTFAQGSKIADPAGLFNASLLGLRRAIDIHEGVVVDAAAFQGLVRAAIAVNVARQT